MEKKKIIEELTTKIGEMNEVELGKFISLVLKEFDLLEEGQEIQEAGQETKKIMQQILKMEVQDCCDLIKKIEEVFQVKAGTGFSSGSEEKAPAAEEKTHYEVIIKGCKTDNKVNFIKALKQARNMEIPAAMAIHTKLIGGGEHSLGDKIAKDEIEKIKSALSEFCDIITK